VGEPIFEPILKREWARSGLRAMLDAADNGAFGIMFKASDKSIVKGSGLFS